MTVSKIQPNELLYLKSDINYTELHFVNGSTLISSYTLKRYQNNENIKHFLRIHHSFLINPGYIKSFQRKNESWIVILINDTEIKVSRRRAKLLKFFNH